MCVMCVATQAAADIVSGKYNASAALYKEVLSLPKS